ASTNDLDAGTTRNVQVQIESGSCTGPLGSRNLVDVRLDGAGPHADLLGSACAGIVCALALEQALACEGRVSTEMTSLDRRHFQIGVTHYEIAAARAAAGLTHDHPRNRAARLLLRDMGEFVSQQALAGFILRLVFAASEGDVVAIGEGARLDLCGAL